MQPFFESLQFIDALITVVGAISTLISLLISLTRKERFKKFKSYIFLSGIAVAGASAGLLFAMGNYILGISVAIFLLISIFVLGANRKVFLNLLLDQESTVVTTRLALYNLLCETIQRICNALIEENSPSSTDIRVSLFQVDWDMEELTIVGRYPLVSERIPSVRYKIGQGTSGVAASENRIIVKEDLPSWEKDSESYIRELRFYNLDESVIRRFHVKSQCYYALPIEYRDPREGVNVVKFIISIDAIYPKISSDKTSSRTVINVINAFIRNHRHLLTETFIGISR